MQSLTEVRLLSSHFGWILEAFAKESADAMCEKIDLVRVPLRKRDYLDPRSWRLRLDFNLKNGKLVFIHHETLMRNLTNLNNRDSRLLLTHFDNTISFNSEFINRLSTMNKIIVQNGHMKNQLVNDLDIDASKINVGYGAVNRDEYFPIKQNSFKDYILIVGDCKTRKNPKLISEVVVLNPSLNFIIHGKGWPKYLSDIALKAGNLQVLPFDQARNPVLMREASLLLSLSKNEGGPIPILEALASGTPVIATDTGFSSDLIRKEFGTIVPIEVEAVEVSELLEETLHLKSSCWDKDLLGGKYTWRELGELLYA